MHNSDLKVIVPDVHVFLVPGDTFSFYRGTEHVYLTTDFPIEVTIKVLDPSIVGALNPFEDESEEG